MKSCLWLVLLVAAALTSAAPGSAGWQNVPLPDGAQYARVVVEADAYLLCACEDEDGQPAGLWRTTSLDPGSAWEYLGLGDVRVTSLARVGSGSLLLAATQDDGKIYRSTDWGTTWVPQGTELPGDRASTLEWNGELPGRVYAAGRNEFSEWFAVSTDTGLSWSVVYTQQRGNTPSLISTRGEGGLQVWNTNCDGFWMSPVNRSLNGGQSWAMLPEPPWDCPATGLLTPAGTDRILSLTPTAVWRWNGYTYAGPWHFGSLGHGARMIAPGWWEGHVVVSGVGHDGLFFVVHRSEFGSEWLSLNEGLPQEPTLSPQEYPFRFSIACGQSQHVLYAGTPTLGLWRRDMSGGAEVREVGPRQDFSLCATPNPSRATVRLAVNGIGSSPVDYRVLDVLGRVVMEVSSSGPEMTWDWTASDGSRLPAGIYLVHARTGSSSVTSQITRLP